MTHRPAMTAGDDQHVIFNSNTAHAWQINARLDSNHHAAAKPALRRLAQERRLVNFKPDAMTQAMHKLSAIAG